jgi:hypothetical protein
MPISSLSSRCITPRTRVPSLHRNYPPSQVLWTPPTPARAQPQRLVAFSAPWQVSRVSPICFHACCAHYPGERIGLLWSVAPTDPGGLRPIRGGSALASSPFEACSGFTRVAARMVAICHKQILSPGLRWLGRPCHRPDSYGDAPTISPTGLAPAANECLSRHPLI